MNNLLMIAGLSMILFTGTIVVASETTPQANEQRFEVASERLSLTAEQAEQMAPVMQDGKEARERILSKYGIDLNSGGDSARNLGFRKMRAMRGELQDVNKTMMDAVEDILDAEQFKEFKRIQKERQDEMRERIRGAR